MKTYREMHLWEHFPDAVEEEWLVQDVPEIIDDVADESQPETETIIQSSMSRDIDAFAGVDDQGLTFADERMRPSGV